MTNRKLTRHFTIGLILTVGSMIGTVLLRIIAPSSFWYGLIIDCLYAWDAWLAVLVVLLFLGKIHIFKDEAPPPVPEQVQQ